MDLQPRSSRFSNLEKYSFREILSATNNFSVENLITEGALGKVYKGELLQDGNSLKFTVRRLDHTNGQGHEFEKEISMLKSLVNKNISSVFGYCDENNEEIIIYEHAFHGTLDQHLSDPTLITWSQRLQICLGVARAINHIHYDVIHCDISSSKILLDENWEPKIYGFEFSTGYPESQRHPLLFSRHFDTNVLTPKYDVYLFGMLMFEVLCGRKPMITIDGVQEELDRIIDPNLRKQMDTQSLELFTSIANKCLNKKPVQRPPMDRIVKELEDVLELHWIHKNLFVLEEHSNAVDEGTSSNSLEMHILRIPLSEIRMATNNFDATYVIGSGGFGVTYKAKLDVLDIQNLSSVEGKSKEELPKIKKHVAIKRIYRRADAQGKQVFLNEVELLTRCKHPNIITLLGFSMENEEMIVVYEYALKGSLGDYLGDASLSDAYLGVDYWSKVNLTWVHRLQICLDIANGLNYLHTNIEGKPMMIHRDIKSENILLDENLRAKLTDFGLSKVQPMYNQASTIYTNNIVGTEFYMDPEYLATCKYKKETDIYSFGVVLFEVLSGRFAYDPIYLDENHMGLAHIARRRFNEGTLKELIDPKLVEEDNDHILTLNRRLNDHSFHTFSNIAYRCLAETQAKRPTLEVIIQELQYALHLQGLNPKERSPIIDFSILPTFSNENLITEGAFGKVYKGQLLQDSSLMNFTVRRLDCMYAQGDELQTEILRLKSLKHKNIISVLGHYDENNEKIIIYEQAFHGTLDQHLSDPTLTWSQRLKICLGVANGLNHIHYDVIHCDINSSKIFLNEDWEPKIYGFEFSTEYPQSWRHRLHFNRYFDTNNMTPKYDVYSYGVLLVEVLCGKKLVITNDTAQQELDKSIDPNLWKEMDIESFKQFKELAYKCLNPQPVRRPAMDQIIKQLKEVLELQLNNANIEHSKAADEEGTSSNRLKMEFLEIPLSEIRQATNDFHKDCLVGSGGYADVYGAELNVLDIQSLSSLKGMSKEELPKIRKTVAMKRINNKADEQGKQGFLNEIELVTSCKHKNIVSLLGFSRENGELVLVYEYASNKSLGDYLKDNGKMVNLTWSQRLQICLDTANGIDYLHTNKEGKPRIIHRDIKSDNVLLDENLNAKVADFGLSKFNPVNKQANTIFTKIIAGTEFYIDPEYVRSGKYKRETDIYSFGVVLFEVLSGRLAYDEIYTDENHMGLAPIARRRFNEETLKELIDPKMIKESDDRIFTLNKGPNQKSFRTFSKIAYQCLAETQAKRPTIDVVIKKLQKALKLQGDTTVLTRFLPDDIVSATENFAEAHCIGLDRNGTVYKTELNQFGNNSSFATKGKNNGEPSKKRISVVIKRITSGKEGQGNQEFFEELEMGTSYKHPNIVSLLGFCNQGDEMILVYEHASNKSLDDYLKTMEKIANFTWTNRLRMCLQIAHGLNHLHTKMANPQRIILNDIKSANIIVGQKWEAKIAYLGISKLEPTNQDIGMKVYEDPEYEKTSKMKTESDIYSFGVVLFEIFCGRVAYDPVYIVENDKGLAAIARRRLKDGTIESIMDPKLKEETDEDTFTSNRGPNQDSLDTFLKIAYQCLGEAAKRPTVEIVIKELEIALKFHDPKPVEFR